MREGTLQTLRRWATSGLVGRSTGAYLQPVGSVRDVGEGPSSGGRHEKCVLTRVFSFWAASPGSLLSGVTFAVADVP